mgnify:CR=1 FL=1
MKNAIKTLFYSFVLYSLIIGSLYLFAVISWSNPLGITEITFAQFLIFGIIFCIMGLVTQKYRNKLTKNNSENSNNKLYKILLSSLIGFIILAVLFLLYFFTKGF